MLPSKYFLLIVTILFGIILQIYPLLYALDVESVAFGIPLPFFQVGPNEVHVGGYQFEEETKFQVSNLIINVVLFVTVACFLEYQNYLKRKS
jgi:hypothetical protein